jgi:DNA invertase Pin-like site-specific DNA recombinase
MTLKAMARKDLTKAIAYLRTSSRTNAGEGKDSPVRQREAIDEFAKANGYEIVAQYYDVTSGENSIDDRPEFARMIEHILGNGAKTIIVETANRFSRDLIIQEIGFKKLQERGIALIAADKPDSFLDDTPTAVLVRQVLGAVAQFDKAMTVQKLKGARDRKRRLTGLKVEGAKNYAEKSPEMVKLAKKLKRYNKLSLREISSKLAEEGFLAKSGRAYGAAAVKRMIEDY